MLITNSSTVDREFAVYGADAFNTADGGYDLLAAAEVSTDVGLLGERRHADCHDPGAVHRSRRP